MEQLSAHQLTHASANSTNSTQRRDVSCEASNSKCGTNRLQREHPLLRYAAHARVAVQMNLWPGCGRARRRTNFHAAAASSASRIAACPQLTALSALACLASHLLRASLRFNQRINPPACHATQEDVSKSTINETLEHFECTPMQTRHLSACTQLQQTQ